MSDGPQCQLVYAKETRPKQDQVYCLRFANSEGDEVGMLDFSGRGLVFEGVAEASAILFMEWVGEMFKQRLMQEYQRGLAEGKKLAHKPDKM
jgi:hypothetical protein